MKDEEVISRVKEAIEQIDNADVYFALKKMRIRGISEQTVKTVKIFLALRQMGVSVVSSHLFSIFYDASHNAAIAILHRLGDKKVLTFVRENAKGPLRYVLGTEFLQYYEHPDQKVNIDGQ